MKISIACDHGALDMKNKLVAYLQKQGHEVADFGTHTLASCDYPEFCGAAASLCSVAVSRLHFARQVSLKFL